MRKDQALTEKLFNCGMHKRVPARIIEKFVHSKIEQLLLSDDLANGIIQTAKDIHAKNYSIEEKEKSCKRDISNYTGQLEALSERLAKLPVEVPADEIYKTLKILGEKRERAKSELEEVLKSGDLGHDLPVELRDYKRFLGAIKLLWFNPKTNTELKEKLMKAIVSRIEVDTNEIFIEYWVGKGHFSRQEDSIDLRGELQR